MDRSRTASAEAPRAGLPTFRLAALLAAVAAAGAVVLWLAGPWLADPWPTAGRSFADHAGTACALALVMCWAWLALGTLLVGLQVLRPSSVLTRMRLGWVPVTIRVLVPVAVGVAVAAAPAAAAPDPSASQGTAASLSAGSSTTSQAGATDPSGLTGLPLPDRPVTSPTGSPPGSPAASPAASARTDVRPTVRVRPGDSLWLITARLLGPGAGTADVVRGWQHLARANAGVLDDPDLILPGTRLRLPPLLTDPREDAR